MKYAISLLGVLCAFNFCLGQSTYFNKEYDFEGKNEVGKSVITLADTTFLSLAVGKDIVLNSKIIICKIDNYGDVIWKTIYGEDGFEYFDGDLLATSDGFVIYCTREQRSTAYTDFFLLKMDKAGQVLWTKTYDISFEDVAEKFISTKDKGFLLAGYSRSQGPSNSRQACFLKIDSLGNQEWAREYGESAIFDRGITAREMRDNSYLLLVVNNSSSDLGNTRLIKVDEIGEVIWSKTYGNAIFNYVKDMVLTSDGGCIIAGYEHPFQAEAANGWVFKVDSVGQILWNKIYGTEAKLDAFGNIILLPNGTLALAGISKSHNPKEKNEVRIWLTKIREDGTGISTNFYDSGTPLSDNINDFALTLDGGFIFCGTTLLPNKQNAWLLKTDSLYDSCYQADCDSRSTRPLPPIEIFPLYPNPSAGTIKVPIAVEKGELTIYDMAGRLVFIKELGFGENELTLNLGNGNYIVRLKTDRAVSSQKLLLVR